MAKTYQKTKLQEVTIKGYKSIAFNRPVTLKLNDVSILLGANGAGKSNIISFFRRLSYMMSKSFGKYVEMSGTSNALLHYGTKKTPVMSGEIKFSDSKSIDTYSFSLSNATPDRLIITEERIVWHRKGKVKPYEVTLEPVFKESALAESDNPVAKTIFQMLSYCKVYQFHDSSVEGPLRQVCPVETTNYLQSHGNNLPSFLLFLREIIYVAFDRDFAQTQGLPVKLIEYAMMCCIAVTIVFSIRLVGIMLLISLLTLPQITVNLFTSDFKRIMVGSIAIGFLGCVCGLLLSYYLNVPSGAFIILFLVLLFLISKAIKAIVTPLNKE